MNLTLAECQETLWSPYGTLVSYDEDWWRVSPCQCDRLIVSLFRRLR